MQTILILIILIAVLYGIIKLVLHLSWLRAFKLKVFPISRDNTIKVYDRIVEACVISIIGVAILTVYNIIILLIK